MPKGTLERKRGLKGVLDKKRGLKRALERKGGLKGALAMEARAQRHAPQESEGSNTRSKGEEG